MSNIKKVKSVSIEVFERDDQFWTTSLDVAEKFGKQHKNVLQSIEKLDCSEQFTRLNFQPSTRQTRAGEEKYYIISRDGFSFLAMGFTGKKAAEWKEKYIEAFNKMEKTIIAQAKQLRREANREWKQLRDNSKTTRKTCTDAIQKFCDYAISQGSKNASFYYKILTDAEYDAVIIPGGHMEIRNRKKELKKTNGRDVMTTDELIRISIMDMTATRKAVDDALENGGDYHKIYLVIKEKILRYGEMINNSLLLQDNIKMLALAV